MVLCALPRSRLRTTTERAALSTTSYRSQLNQRGNVVPPARTRTRPATSEAGSERLENRSINSGNNGSSCSFAMCVRHRCLTVRRYSIGPPGFRPSAVRAQRIRQAAEGIDPAVHMRAVQRAQSYQEIARHARYRLYVPPDTLNLRTKKTLLLRAMLPSHRRDRTDEEIPCCGQHPPW